MRISPYIKIKRIHSSSFAPVFTGTNTTVSIDVRDRNMPTFYKTRKEAIEAIKKFLPKYITL